MVSLLHSNGQLRTQKDGDTMKGFKNLPYNRRRLLMMKTYGWGVFRGSATNVRFVSDSWVSCQVKFSSGIRTDKQTYLTRGNASETFSITMWRNNPASLQYCGYYSSPPAKNPREIAVISPTTPIAGYVLNSEEPNPCETHKLGRPSDSCRALRKWLQATRQ